MYQEILSKYILDNKNLNGVFKFNEFYKTFINYLVDINKYPSLNKKVYIFIN